MNRDTLILFRGNIFYPRGGWKDFGGYFHDIDAAKKSLPENDGYLWAHVVDMFTGEIVWDSREDE